MYTIFRGRKRWIGRDAETIILWLQYDDWERRYRVAIEPERVRGCRAAKDYEGLGLVFKAFEVLYLSFRHST